MNILFIHQNFPGQFKYLAPALVQRGHGVVAERFNRTLKEQAIHGRVFRNLEEVRLVVT